MFYVTKKYLLQPFHHRQIRVIENYRHSLTIQSWCLSSSYCSCLLELLFLALEPITRKFKIYLTTSSLGRGITLWLLLLFSWTLVFLSVCSYTDSSICGSVGLELPLEI